MALTRKFLAALGIEADKIDEIITAHLDTVNGLKQERDDYKAEADKLPSVQAELEKAKEDDGYKEKYKTLKSEYDKYKADIAAEKEAEKKQTAYKELLKECGIPEKRIKAVIRLTNFDEVKLTKDGEIEGVEDVKKSIKNDWAEYIPTNEDHGADTATPPGGDGSGGRAPSRAAMVAQKHYEAIYGKKEGSK